MMTDLTPEKDGKVNHDMEDDVIRGATVTFDQAIAAKSEEKPKELTPEEVKAAEATAFKKQTKQQIMLLGGMAAFLLAVGTVAPASFMQHFIVFVLSVFVGFQVIWNVSHSLHTPLMAVTNAISSIIILGALMQIGSGSFLVILLAALSVFMTGINIVGGFLVTRRMLAMFQKSAKRAVWYGIVGMGLAVFATLIGPGSGLWLLSLILIAGGGFIGWQVATRVEMTEMPQLVAAMHSLVGLAAVFVGLNAHFEMGRVAGMDEATLKALDGFAALIAKKDAVEIGILKVEVFLGIFIGAITFTGSVIAYGKLAGKVNSKATKLPGGHMLNAAATLFYMMMLRLFTTGHRLSPDHGHWRCGHACCCLYAQLLLRVGGCCDWL